MLTSIRRTKLCCLLVFLALAVATVSAAEQAPTAPAAQLEAVPPGAASADADAGGSISSPAGGSDAASILSNEAHMMGGSEDSTDSEKDDDTKSQSGQKRDGHGGHKGQCVTACATKSTDGVGCGNDLSKPDCFCKSESFIDQTFACINATCPQQFHGAAGVITSICAVAGAPNLTIAGYNNSNNLENMPTINTDNSTNITTTPTDTNKPNTPGTTSTFTMPVSAPTPNAGPTKNTTQQTTGATGQPSAAVHQTGARVAVAVTGALTIASFAIWTLF